MGAICGFSVAAVDLCGLCGELFVFLPNISPNPIFENGNMEIDEQPGVAMRKLKISQNNGLVCRANLLDGLQFHNNAVNLDCRSRDLVGYFEIRPSYTSRVNISTEGAERCRVSGDSREALSTQRFAGKN
jgi:hypothetical protein